MSLSRQQRVRLGILLVGMTAYFALILVRLAQLQIVNASEYDKIVQRQSGGRCAVCMKQLHKGMALVSASRTMHGRAILYKSISGKEG